MKHRHSRTQIYTTKPYELINKNKLKKINEQNIEQNKGKICGYTNRLISDYCDNCSTNSAHPLHLHVHCKHNIV